MRDYEDIPEPFRRALEEVGWGESNDGGDDSPPSGPRQPGRPWWSNRSVWITVLIILFLMSFNWIVTTYTDWLWFTALDYDEAWLRQWGYRVGSFLVFFAASAFMLLLNWHIARRRAIRSGNNNNPILQLPGIGWVISGIALFLSFIFSQAGVLQWQAFLRFVYRVRYGEVDPIFGLDISFYLFELPVYKFLQDWLLFLTVMALLGSAAMYVISNARILPNGRIEVADTVSGLRRHAAILGTIALLLWAVEYWLGIYELVFSSRGVVFGASYTDLNAQLPALRVQAIVSVLMAIAVAINIFRFNWRLPAAAVGLWLVATIGLGGIYPSLLQRYSVTPNELERESTFIRYNIDYTRLAFGLDAAITQTYSIGDDLTQQDIDNEVALTNVRVWDYRPLQETYTQLQGLRPYYQFNEVDIDRYEIDGQMRQVMLATRELKKEGLQSTSWLNETLIFTHGYGVVMNPVDLVTPDGQPEFFLQDLPPTSTVGIEITQPEIYYGELDGSIVLVGSNQMEFNYPKGDTNVENSYDGDGGILINSALRRLAFTIRFGQTDLLLNDDITPQTRIMFNRTIRERVQEITPFLALDDDPYIVIADGKLYWMIDAYTVSRSFPFAEPVAGDSINYIRNSVKITVDAYHGTVNYYIADSADPIIRTYQRAFPSLFKNLDEMPDSLRSHIRYPEGLFKIQTEQYLTYHMDEVPVFYNKEDRWQIPEEKLSEGGEQDKLVRMEPYYVMMTLPGESEPEYLLIQPYTPAGKDNMIAWIAARNDPENYGELVVFELPKQELVFGPSQIEARIDQDTDISGQISLWNQQGSEVLRGNLIVIPMANNFLYVEPLYLQAESSALPELKRVIVATGDRIVMRENLTDALAALLLESGNVAVVEPLDPVDTEAPEDTSDGEDEATDTTPPVAVDQDSINALIDSANDHFEAAQTAQRNGDWATYGAEIEALEADLARLAELTGESE